jgi:hypothetical protein
MKVKGDIEIGDCIKGLRNFCPLKFNFVLNRKTYVNFGVDVEKRIFPLLYWSSLKSADVACFRNMVRAQLQTKCAERMLHVVLAVTMAASLVSGCWPALNCTGVYHCPIIPYVPGAVIESGDKYRSCCPVSVTYLGKLELAIHWSTKICFKHRVNLSVRLLTQGSRRSGFDLG